MCPLLRRFQALDMLLKIGATDDKGESIYRVGSAPEVVVEDDESKKIYNQVFNKETTEVTSSN
jgi:hypothetical protein